MGKDVNEVTQKLQLCLEGVQRWYCRNRLKVNATKSNVMLMGSRQKLSKYDINDFNIIFDGVPLKRTNVMKYLGVQVDNQLSWDHHIKYVCKIIAPKLAHLRRLSSFLPPGLTTQIYKTYVQPCIDYCSTVWGNSSAGNIRKIQHLQNTAARIVTKNYDFINVRGIDLVKELGWNDFVERRDFMASCLIYKCVYGIAPHYLCDNVLYTSDVNERVTRYNNGINLYTACPRLDKYKQSLFYWGAQIWNCLKNDTRECKTIQSFKRNYFNNINVKI